MPFRGIDDPVKLRRLLEAVLMLEADVSLPELLRHFVEEACSMTGARYGALGVLDEQGTSLAEFITVGLSEAAERKIGTRPKGRGLLGLLITDPQPLRIRNIAQHPDSAGFPPKHPPMTSFLGLPVTAHDEVYGNLYLTDKVGWTEFTADDQALVTAFAQAAGIAIEKARLHSRVQEVAVLEDRDRIARDLHDAVIQRLFAVGLSLQGIARPPVAPEVVARLNQAIGEIDETIRQIRTSIFELGSTSAHRGLRAKVLALVGDLRPVVGFDVSASFDGPVDSAISPQVTEHLLYTVREALTNVGRHAQASRASVRVRVADGICILEVTDNGRGMLVEPVSGKPPAGGLGMANLRQRAERLGGDLNFGAPEGGGTSLVWRVPASQWPLPPSDPLSATADEEEAGDMEDGLEEGRDGSHP